jgi:hypothetical protein
VPVVAHDRNPERLPARERDDGIQDLHAATEHVQRELRPGHVRDDEVEEALACLQPRGLAEDRRRREACEVREHLRADSLARALQFLHRDGDVVKSLRRVLDRDRKRRPHRGDLVPECSTLGFRAHRHGDHRLQLEAVRTDAELVAHEAAERERHGGEHDVVERATERVLDRFELSKVGVEVRVAAMRADLDVERAVGRRRADSRDRRRADVRDPLDQLGGGAARRAEEPACAAHHLGGNGRAFAQRFAEQLRGPRQRLCDPWLSGLRGRHRLRRGVEEHRRDVHSRDPVHERMVGLRDQSEAAARHRLHEPDLPQWLRAIEALREQPPGEPLQLGVVGGLGQRGVADVVARVEMGVVRPHRPALIEGHVLQALAVARDEVQAGGHVLVQLRGRGRFAFEHHHRRDVHVRSRVVLEMQERRVEGRQAVRVRHRR